MNKRNRIILLVDFSEHSKHLYNFALRVAESIRAELLIVHKITAITPGMSDQESRDEIVRIETKSAYTKLQKLTEGSTSIPILYHVSKNHMLTILRDLKNDRYFDIVMTGLKTTGVLKRIFIGSTTLSVIDETDFPTIAVPLKAPVSVPRKLLVGITPEFPLNMAQFDMLLTLFGDHIQQITFFTIINSKEKVESSDLHLKSLQQKIKDYRSDMLILYGVDALEEIKKVVANSDAFLVLQQGSRTLFDQLFRKFVINELVYTGLTPLIVISK